MDERCAAFGGGKREGAGVAEEIEHAFFRRILDEIAPQGTMVEKKSRIEIVGEIDVELNAIFPDDARNGGRRVVFIVLFFAFLFFSRFEKRVHGRELECFFAGGLHAFEPTFFFDGIFFVGALIEG